MLRWDFARSGAPIDDAFITLRYARALASGHGLVFHPGDPVFALSGPLPAALLASAQRLHLDPSKLLVWPAFLCDLAVTGIVLLLARRAAGPAAAWLGGLFCAFFPWQALACGYGMETQLFMLFVYGAFLALDGGHGRLAAAAAALAVLTRPEGWIVSVLVLGRIVVRRPQSDRRAAGAPPRFDWPAILVWALLVLPWTIHAAIRYGSPLPSSIAAKARKHVSVASVLDFFGGNPLLAALWVAALAGFLALARGRGRRAGSVLCALWLCAYVAFFLLGRPSFLGPWYRPPSHPALCLLAGIGVATLAERWRERRPLWTRWMPVLVGGAWLLVAAYAAPRALHWARQQRATVEAVYRPMGLFAREESAPGDTVLCGDIGYIGYISERPMLDLGGLVSPRLVPYLRTHPSESRSGVALALARRPRLFFVFEPERYTAELGRPEFIAAYREAAVFPPPATPPLVAGRVFRGGAAYLRR